MSGEEELAGNLKAFEAELAALAPRTDRLDRERLMFLAGRESAVAGSTRPVTRDRRWLWPTASAAMTTVAASLLMMLLSRPEPEVPEPEVIVRFVEVPVERVAENEAEPAGPIEPLPTDDEHVEPPQGPQQAIPQPVGRMSLLSSIGLGWLENPYGDRLRSRAPYPRLLEQILSDRLEPWPPSVPSQRGRPAAAPVPYRQLLDSLLDRQAQDNPQPDWPARDTFLYPGANS